MDMTIEVDVKKQLREIVCVFFLLYASVYADKERNKVHVLQMNSLKHSLVLDGPEIKLACAHGVCIPMGEIPTEDRISEIMLLGGKFSKQELVWILHEYDHSFDTKMLTCDSKICILKSGKMNGYSVLDSCSNANGCAVRINLDSLYRVYKRRVGE